VAAPPALELADRLEELTSNLRQAQKLLGHATQQTTAGYAHQREPIDSSEILGRHFVNCGLLVAQEKERVQ
jgi:hypothetical protein